MTTREQVKQRVLAAAHIYVYEDVTMRELAEEFGVNKTTIHDDLRVRLPQHDMELYDMVDEKIQQNLRERASRGGNAKSEKYKKE